MGFGGHLQIVINVVLDGRGLDSVGPIVPGCTVVQVTYFGILFIYLIIYYFINYLFYFIKLTAKSELIYQFVEHLKQAVESYEQRINWLTTKSRQIFGVILEQCITIVLDFGGMREEELSLCQDALIMVLEEQVAHIAKFNIIW